jgi:hypothetical protein
MPHDEGDESVLFPFFLILNPSHLFDDIFFLILLSFRLEEKRALRLHNPQKRTSFWFRKRLKKKNVEAAIRQPPNISVPFAFSI